MEVKDILERATEKKVMDIFLVAGLPITYKLYGTQERDSGDALTAEDTERLVKELYALGGRDPALCVGRDDDFSISVARLGRFRANVFRQRGSLAAVVRVIQFGLPEPASIGIPESVMALAEETNGLVLVTGAAGNGKSTTLACMVDRINRSRKGHIITMEDPIEFVHRHGCSIVTQREISIDIPDYISALRSAMRESPDVILLGEMRDYETAAAALSAAETGVLLLSSLHTVSAANTISRIVDMFPAAQQQQIKIQLSQSLRGIVCQQLITSVDGGPVPAFEIMKATPAIQNMIRDDKLHQLDSAIQSGAADGMCTMDQSLYGLYKSGTITRETALARCLYPEMMAKRIGT